MMSDRKILITGCGRSGTTYILKLLNNLGIDVGHETRMGKNGIVSGFLAYDTISPPKGIVFCKHEEFDTILHQVREPIKVISSVLTGRSWGFVEKCNSEVQDEDLGIRCAKYWYYFNKHVESISKFTYRIENIDKEIYRILDEFNIKLDKEKVKKSILKLPKNINTRKHENLTYDYIKEKDLDLFNKIKNMANKYGYKVDLD